ncbi:MAG: hypothetical protein ACLP9L_29770 [Thermoguttaceae bacterium]
MVGVICTNDILLHPVVTVRAFGWRVFFRAVFRGPGDTFLSLLQRDGFFTATSSKEPELIERCVWLELQSAAIYRSLAERFSVPSSLREFLDELAEEEQEHADLLRVCKAFACKGRFVSNRFSPWHDYVPLLEQQMQQAVASLDQIKSMDDVVQLILQIEGSEINHVFLGIVRATDSPFVKKLGPFRRAVKHHINYICKRISRLTPSAALACRDLRAKFQGFRLS